MNEEKPLSDKRRTTAGGSWSSEDGEFLFKKDVAHDLERLHKELVKYYHEEQGQPVFFPEFLNKKIKEIFGDLK